MIYTYVNMYMLATDTRSNNENILVRLRFGEPGGIHPPRISRSIYNCNSRVVLFSDLLILFYLIIT